MHTQGNDSPREEDGEHKYNTDLGEVGTLWNLKNKEWYG
jgi:hypothetical protein